MKKIHLALFLLLALAACNNNPAAYNTGREGNAIPNVKLLLPDSSSYFNTANIPSGQPVVLFYFSPHCPYCRAQMTEITQKMAEMKNVKFYFMTYSPFKPFKNIYKEFKLAQ